MVFITGAGSGLGRALSVAAGYRGARVLVSDIDETAMATTARLVQEAGGTPMLRRLDTRDAATWSTLCDELYATWGRCDLLVNNAGVGAAGPVGEASLEDWRWVVDINLNGVLYGCRAFAPRMKRDGRGTIVNVASIAAFARAPMMGAYNVSKAAVVALSETLRAECLSHGVGVTVVCPSFFRTNIGRSSRVAPGMASMDMGRLVDESRIPASDIAQAILQAVEAGRPYVVPQTDAKVMWWLRRLAPAKANVLLAKGSKLVLSRMRRRHRSGRDA